jgi:hypothetical protein
LPVGSTDLAMLGGKFSDEEAISIGQLPQCHDAPLGEGQQANAFA